MDISIVGATGYVGSALAAEALARGHAVTAVARRPDRLPGHPRLRPAALDVNDADGLAGAFAGRQAVIHAFAPPKDLSVVRRVEAQRQGTLAILAAMRRAGVRRILAVGGAGTLEVEPGLRNMDRPEYPKEWEGGAKATALIKDLLMAAPDIEWTYLSPPHLLVPGDRTGRFRLGLDALLVGADGQSRITLADYAVAMIDELEEPRHTGRRFTVGY